MAVSLLFALVGGSVEAQQPPRPMPAIFPTGDAPSVITDHFERPPLPVPVTGAKRHRSPQAVTYGTQTAGFQESPKYIRPSKEDEDDADFQVNTELPALNRLVRRNSEKEFFERIRQEARRRTGADKVPFPEEIALTKEKYQPRSFPPALRIVEPSYLAHGRLTFEQPNFERAGWDMGFLQPPLSLGIFFWDMVTLPYQMCKRPFEQTETSAGKCLPGDPDPFVLYPPELSVTGLLGESAVIVGGLAIFPPALNPK